MRSDNETPSFGNRAAYPQGDTDRWVVRLGRHAPEKVSGAPKGALTRVRNSRLNAKVKARLTMNYIARFVDAKAGLSERQKHICGALV